MKDKGKWTKFETGFGKNQEVNMPTHKKKGQFPGIMDASQWVQMISYLQGYSNIMQL